jgi:hypothetical protein
MEMYKEILLLRKIINKGMLKIKIVIFLIIQCIKINLKIILKIQKLFKNLFQIQSKKMINSNKCLWILNGKMKIENICMLIIKSFWKVWVIKSLIENFKKKKTCKKETKYFKILILYLINHIKRKFRIVSRI